MPNVLITGASTGIGRELAIAWTRRGARVVLSARGADALEALARELGPNATAVPGDLTDDAYRRELIDRAGELDVLVNNAGRGYYAPVARIDLDELRSLFELNVVAPLHLAQLALPSLERTKGTIVMMSSITGVIAAPRHGSYAASKFALEALSMALRAEVASSGVKIVVVRPGPVATPFRANASRAAGLEGYDAVAPNAQPANEVAEVTIRAVEKDKAVVETSPFVTAAIAAARFVPPALRFALRRRVASSG